MNRYDRDEHELHVLKREKDAEIARLKDVVESLAQKYNEAMAEIERLNLVIYRTVPSVVDPNLILKEDSNEVA